ncbi:hypothetical protein AC578_8729 [Pseudocercospora eumusae]|uniref:F-box domain-containing protein n=1 Tax=Pseudocercospora eumusae TaxID=321146 RepID=A0A139HQC7_9PEZI|nr:hypothetical protein AC578_8729 [Pseudocercospora eumusae]
MQHTDQNSAMQLSNCATSSKEIVHRNDFSTEAQARHITQNLHPASAATRALGIFELLENVATHLDPCDTFVLRRVSKTWRNVLEQEHFTYRLVHALEMPIKELASPKHPLGPRLLHSAHIFNLSNRLQDKSQRILRVCAVPSRHLLQPLRGSPALQMGTWRKVPACQTTTKKVRLCFLGRLGAGMPRHIDVVTSTRWITIGDLADVWLRVLARYSSIDQVSKIWFCSEAVVNMDGEAIPLEQLIVSPEWRDWQQENVADETIQVV